MNKTEYEALQKEIIHKFGKPEYDMYEPQNESALKLRELRLAYTNQKQKDRRDKRLIEGVNNIPHLKEPALIPVPPQLIDESWMTPFTEQQRLVIKQWSKNIKQKPSEIGTAVNVHWSTVRAVFDSEAFGLLRKRLAIEWKEMLPLEAVWALQDCLNSPMDNVKLQAAKLILNDANLIKESPTEINIASSTKIQDIETEKKLKEIGDKVLGIMEQ
jgi:hypothetical protein